MRTFTDALALDRAPLSLERFRRKVMAVLALAVLCFLCATVLISALGLVMLAASTVYADGVNQTLLGLLAAK